VAISAQLGLVARIMALAIGVPLGTLAALRQNPIWDYLSMGVAIFDSSVPSVVLGPLLIMVFALCLGWLPVAGWGTPDNVIIPTLALASGSAALIARLTGASMQQVIREDFVRTARAKGLADRVIMVRHALRTVLIPAATVLGPIFAYLVTVAFVVEQIFRIPA
jgi:oligopeptide transport system permease protein